MTLSEDDLEGIASAVETMETSLSVLAEKQSLSREVYRTGKYIVTGAESEEDLYRVRDRFLTLLSEEEIPTPATDDDFAVQNLVCTAGLGEEQNLHALAIGLGLEQTEYEPEQFPGLIYRPADYPWVLLIFATEKVVITGSTELEEATDAFSELRRRIEDLTEDV